MRACYRGEDAIALLGALGLACDSDMPRARDPTALDVDDDDVGRRVSQAAGRTCA